MVFLEKKNITKEEHLLNAVKLSGGDVKRFLHDFQSEEVLHDFQNEMDKGRKMGVRGFPTFIFIGKEGSGFKISGMSGYKNYVLALEKAFGEKINAEPIIFKVLDLLRKYKYVSTKEVAYILNKDEATTISNLELLVSKGNVKKEKQKFGFFWRYIKN